MTFDKGEVMSGKFVLGVMLIAALFAFVACDTDLTETEDDEEDNCYSDDSGNRVCCGHINNGESACCWDNQYGNRTCDNTPCHNECEVGVDTRCSGFTGPGYEGPDDVAGLVDECRIDDRDMRHCSHWVQRERCEEGGWCSEEGGEAHCVYCSELFPDTELCQFEDAGHCHCENDDFDWPWRQWLHVCRQIPETVCASWRRPECRYGTCDNYRCQCDALP